MIRRILFVSRFMKGGGAERVISVLSSALVDNMYDVAVMSYLVSDEDYDIDCRITKYSMGHCYCEEKGNAVSRTLYRRKRLKQVINEHKPDIIIPLLELKAYQLLQLLEIFQHIIRSFKRKFMNIYTDTVRWYFFKQRHNGSFLIVEQQKNPLFCLTQLICDFLIMEMKELNQKNYLIS